MTRRYSTKSTSAENLRIVARAIPWKILLFIPVAILIAIPAYVYSSNASKGIMPGMTKFFYNLSAPTAITSPTPQPMLLSTLPQVGSILYTVQGGDSCDSILTYQMRMADAGQIFSDANPVTVKTLNATLGQDCHALQPGMVLPLSPQYPLVALGGVVVKIEATSPQQVLPTPLINVPDAQPYTVDCSGGCLLIVRIAPQVQVRLTVQTTLPIVVGAWVWAQASLARKQVASFPNYPYADPQASLNNMSLQACDFQVNNTHDDNSQGCDQLMPNTIDDDSGSWLFGVTGTAALDHWHYGLHVPAGTRVLLWLTNNNGVLKFHKGNPVYRYDDASHVYVPA
ncbi:MAG TPA: hypothetical protein DHW02_16165 [Ktedonobacter sp.]|nr:hypothetical protein [Ktedonobacter sp.]